MFKKIVPTIGKINISVAMMASINYRILISTGYVRNFFSAQVGKLRNLPVEWAELPTKTRDLLAKELRKLNFFLFYNLYTILIKLLLFNLAMNNIIFNIDFRRYF